MKRRPTVQISRVNIGPGIYQEAEQTLVCVANSPQDLLKETGARLDDLFSPRSSVIYGRTGGLFEPVVARGRAIPPAVAVGGSLIRVLGRAGRPLGLPFAGPGMELDPAEQAMLESLATEVLVPILREGRVEAFISLAEKHSGDIYTKTDLALLAAVAANLSARLQRFDQAEILDRSRTMQKALRRYVPGAVADEIASGHDLESGRREVTVLFVDIRGYTAYAEQRQAEDVFTMLNRYTGLVSEIVLEQAGSVVEFNGDGMMAVFGAPKALDKKERAAVDAGLAMVSRVGSLRQGAEGRDEDRVEVGVGIATGEAFVGNIRAVDRDIWSAVGNTTNLAARLQGLTRDLGASIVIDATTYARVSQSDVPFEVREQVAIRGRGEQEDVYFVR